MKLRLSELYTSVQGEGPNVGTPTTFVRFAGCNMRCPGWPCDSPYAIEPSLFNKESEWVTPDDIFERLKEHPSRNVTLTGGEPFLQPNELLQELFEKLWRDGYSIDIFTNGSRPFPRWTNHYRVTVIMDWKLKGSGEAGTERDIREVNRFTLLPKDAVKFVVKDLDDLREAQDLHTLWGPAPVHQTYIGPAWMLIEPEVIVNFILEHNMHDVKLNLQTHKMIWPNIERGI
jgi:7-carboxy-7-deazaguanine synthase